MKALYHYQRGKKLRCGYTTGSCATAAAKAAAYMIIHQRVIDRIAIDTPAGVILELDVVHPAFDQQQATCCIVKDAGDDHDITDGIEIWATVKQRTDGQISISGGLGIGRITKPGFWGKPGEAAINPVPRKMITTELAKLAASGWDVELSAPQGQELAAKTLNAKLGIADGISIIGTTGIVEPMSNEALKQTIYLEIDDVSQSGSQEILLHLGNYGQKVASELGLDYPSVKISNFIGDAVLYCKHKAFRKVVLIGHIGKISKLSIGAFNTHSSVCDLRLEAFVYYLALAGAPLALMNKVLNCSDSEEILQLIREQGYGMIVTTMRQGCIDRIRKYVKDPDFNIEVIVYSMASGIIG